MINIPDFIFFFANTVPVPNLVLVLLVFGISFAAQCAVSRRMFELSSGFC